MSFSTELELSAEALLFRFQDVPGDSTDMRRITVRVVSMTCAIVWMTP